MPVAPHYYRLLANKVGRLLIPLQVSLMAKHHSSINKLLGSYHKNTILRLLKVDKVA